jgi:hypothetical protein
MELNENPIARLIIPDMSSALKYRIRREVSPVYGTIFFHKFSKCRNIPSTAEKKIT